MQIDIGYQPWEQNFIQRKINQTLLFKVNKAKQLRYILIELFVITRKHQANILLLQSYQEAPCFENNSSRKQIRYENADIYGKQQLKKYHYIVLDQENKTEFSQFLVILTNQTTKYKLIIQNLSQMPCPNNCNNNGICKNGVCLCNSGYLDHDCSQKGLQITPFQQFQQKNDNEMLEYIYMSFNYTLSFNMLIKFSKKWENITDVRVQILISQKFNLPSDSNNTYDDIINDKKIAKYKIKSNINLIDNEQIKNFTNQTYFLLIKIISNKNAKCCIQIEFDEYVDEDDEKLIKLLVILSIAVIILSCFGIIAYRCFRQKSDKQNQNRMYSNPIQEDIQNYQECPICLDNFEINQLTQLAKLDCNHIFHIQCLTLWRTYYTNTIYSICPCCRQAME
ncbi:unnamed protein product [Paramecium pentaurelia]|uniref:RING-type domain-containing protein n=1 Tax=Paramecium pentaurelia TaxID=43138 RepID=A0A8S1XAS5_9CILI|nr:unnamed protein product [Paramecium pentaurelia]